MCGRFVATSSPAMLVDQFNVTRNDVVDAPPDYNVTPRAQVMVVRQRDAERFLSRVRWGLIPSSARDAKTGDRRINARAEGIARKPAYRRAFAAKRCIVPVDGFYEWTTIAAPSTPKGRPRKQPMFIQARNGTPLALAGLWEIWKVPEGEHFDGADHGWLRSCTIITTTSNELLAPVHDRMPVVLPAGSWDEWLDPATDRAALEELLVPTPANELEMWPVSAAVNSPTNNAPELLREVVEEFHDAEVRT